MTSSSHQNEAHLAMWAQLTTLINWGIPHLNICNDKMKNSFFKIQIPQKLRMTRFKIHQVSMLVGSKSNKLFYLSTECLTGISLKQRERLSQFTNPRYICKLQCDANYAIWNFAFRTVWTATVILLVQFTVNCEFLKDLGRSSSWNLL